MIKQILIRWIVIIGLLLTSALSILIYDEFSTDAMADILITVGLGIVTALLISFYIIRTTRA